MKFWKSGFQILGLLFGSGVIIYSLSGSGLKSQIPCPAKPDLLFRYSLSKVIKNPYPFIYEFNCD